jgi:16S rRNA (adenine1518-N6/adenine1519-N6)-dimethyltransferase
VRTAASAEILMRLAAEAFDPAPDVDSALLLMRPTAPARFADEAFFAFARAVFQERRKKLPNAVANAIGHDVLRARKVVQDAGIEAMRRPQTLDLVEWETLYRAFLERT